MFGRMIATIALSFLLFNWLRPAAAEPMPGPAEMLWCGRQGAWQNITEDNIGLANADKKTVVIMDTGPCWWLAEGISSNTRIDLSKRTGGEYVWCSRILELLQKLGYNTVFTKTARAAEKFILAGQRQGTDHLLLVHWGYDALSSPEKYGNASLIRPPFREECLIMMWYYGIEVPRGLWPGDLKFYLAVYPHIFNSYTGLPQPPDCPVRSAEPSVPLKPSYGVVFGKFGVTAKVTLIPLLFRNASLWSSLSTRTHLVFVSCNDALAEALGLGINYRERYTCWTDLPERGSYHQLLWDAAFVIGLGTPELSPTPVEALWCRTPVIMPPGQHRYLSASAPSSQFHAVRSTQDVLVAVDKCLQTCSPIYQRNGTGVSVEKINRPCFGSPPPMDIDFSIDVVAPKLEKMLKERESQCIRS
ncbi:hypothetical protein Vafri_20058 [Volvox africanus]|uniref:Uncharacterized protein n=1 Tax=Volvox africanus TaxID=51714 RepID=A0A8J4FCR7_9CHLO|nr:hypothetical protein Vafri_20058 [Volvox africanus]